MAVVLLTAAVTAPAFEFVSLGTGAITGLYYPTGRAICSLANHEDAGGAVRCSVEPTSGSVYNVDHLATGDLDFALIQSDVQFDAYTGRGPWAARPMPELRSVFTVFTEAVAIVARADLDVTGLDSLKGMRLSVGNPGSGARATWEKIEAALGWKREDLRLRPACARRRASMRCAMTRSTHSCCCRATLRLLWTRRAAGCLIRLFGVEGPAIDQLVAASPYYRHTVVPASAYGFGADIKTFGSAATLVTSTHVADAVVHAIAKAVLGHLDEFGALTPTMVGMTPAEMIHDSLTAPLHPGAERAYRELGLMR